MYGRRVDVPQGAVDVERRSGRRRVEALRQDGLVDLAGGDVFLNLLDRAFERLARLVGDHFERRRVSPFGAREVALQLALEKVDLRAGEVVEPAKIFARPQPRVGDREDPMLDVIERQDGVEDHERGLIAVGRRLVQRHGALEPLGGVVVEIADGAADEARQLGHERRLELGHQPAQHVDERLAPAGLHAGLLHRRLRVAAAQDHERVLAEERVAADVLAALDALEQERVVGVLRDLQERRHRRQQVRHDLAPHRHERAAPRQLHELLERRCSHVLTDSCPRNSSGAALDGSGRRRHARPPLELAARLCDQHLETADRLRPSFARPSKHRGFERVVDHVVDERPGQATRGRSAPRRRSARSRPASC